MYRSYSWILLLLTLSCSAVLQAQCDHPPSIQTTLADREVKPIHRLIEQLEACPHLRDSMALCYHTLGTIYYGLGDLRQAIRTTQRAVDIRQALQPQPLFHLAKSNHNLGVFYKNTDQLSKASQCFNRAKDIYDQIKSARVSKSYRELADIADRKGDVVSSIQLLTIASQKAIDYKDTVTLAKCYLDLSYIFYVQKKYQESIQNTKLAQTLYQTHQGDHRKDLAKCEGNLALSYYDQKNYTTTLFHYQKALQLSKEIDNQEEVSKMWSNMSQVYLKQGNYPKALQSVEKALQIAKSINSPREISQSYNNLGEIYLAQKKFKKALRYFQQDANALIPQFDALDYHVYPSQAQLNLVANKIELLKSFKDKARAWKAYYEDQAQESSLLQMLQTYECADYLVDLIRAEQNNQSSKLVWRENVVSMYEQAIQLCYQLKDTERAFYFFEKSKSILLLEGLLQAQALDIIPDSIAQKEFRLRRELLYAQEDLEFVASSEQEKILEKILDLQNRLRALTQQISQEHPQYFDIKYKLDVSQLTEFKTQLAPQTAFLHFFSGQDYLYLLYVDATQEQLLRLAPTQIINEQLYRFLNFFQGASPIEEAPQAYAQLAFEVYQQLLGQVALPANHSLVIVPDGLLSFVPFEALLHQPNFTNLADLAYLIKKHPIRYSYSGTILQQQAIQHKAAHSQFVAFAPFADNQQRAGYSPLNYSQDELSNIETQVNGQFLKATQATKHSFFEQAPQANLIHLSTHAVAHADSLQARIIFADTALLLSELYGLDLNADLVVLSACETNIGKIQSGEGVMSMARGFTYAGARSQISSLWKVNAMTTGKIFSTFYQALVAGTSSAQAFHQAKLQHLNDPSIRPSQKSPYYWAGFVFLGQDHIIAMPNTAQSTLPYFLITGSVLLLLVFCWGYWRRKRGK